MLRNIYAWRSLSSDSCISRITSRINRQVFATDSRPSNLQMLIRWSTAPIAASPCSAIITLAVQTNWLSSIGRCVTKETPTKINCYCLLLYIALYNSEEILS